MEGLLFSLLEPKVEVVGALQLELLGTHHVNMVRPYYLVGRSFKRQSTPQGKGGEGAVVPPTLKHVLEKTADKRVFSSRQHLGRQHGHLPVQNDLFRGTQRFPQGKAEIVVRL